MTEKKLERIDNLPLIERVKARLDNNLCVSKEDIQELYRQNQEIKDAINYICESRFK